MYVCCVILLMLCGIVVRANSNKYFKLCMFVVLNFVLCFSCIMLYYNFTSVFPISLSTYDSNYFCPWTIFGKYTLLVLGQFWPRRD